MNDMVYNATDNPHAYTASRKKVAIVGAGAAGLMAATALSCYPSVQVCVFEQMPSAARKILMAGKTGLNLSNHKTLDDFVAHYTPSDWVRQYVVNYDAKWLTTWLDELGIETYIGSTGRIFPTSMKAAPFVRRWLSVLQAAGVQFFYRHRCVGIEDNTLSFVKKDSNTQDNQLLVQRFDAIILACGGGSYARLGSDGAWQAWFLPEQITPFYASNVGVITTWSPFMVDFFGTALKRVRLWTLVDGQRYDAQGDVIISHYGFESGTIYQLNAALRRQLMQGKAGLFMDLLPDLSQADLTDKLSGNKKQTLANRWRKLGLDKAKIALLREFVPKADWHRPDVMAQHIKQLFVGVEGLRPIDEAISTGGGVKLSAVTDDLQLINNPYVFVAGEMLDWDAPTGGYLLTACFAMGQTAGERVAAYLGICK